MFKISTSILAITVVLFSFNLSGQFINPVYNEEFPNFIKAENANPTVMIVGLMPGDPTYDFGLYIFDENGEPAKSYDTENPHYKAFEFLVDYMKHRFNKMGITPKGYLNLPKAMYPGQAESMVNFEQMETMLGIKSDFTINVYCNLTSSVLNKFRSNKTVNEKSFKSSRIELYIELFNHDEPEAWLLMSKNKKLSKAFDILESEINDKGDEYFVQRMENPRSARKSSDGEEKKSESKKIVEFKNKVNNHKEVVKAWPSETELRGSKAVYFLEFNESYKLDYPTVSNETEKRYPHQLEIIPVSDFEKLNFNNDEHRFVFFENIEVEQRTIRSTNATSGRTSYYDQMFFSITYSLKDMKTGILYTGPDGSWSKRTVENNNKKSFRKFLKQLEKEYNW